jgi:hypothetical protein
LIIIIIRAGFIYFLVDENRNAIPIEVRRSIEIRGTNIVFIGLKKSGLGTLQRLRMTPITIESREAKINGSVTATKDKLFFR